MLSVFASPASSQFGAASAVVAKTVKPCFRQVLARPLARGIGSSTPRATAHLAALAWLCFGLVSSGCGEAANAQALEAWLEQVDAVEVGAVVEGAEQGPAGHSQLRGAGFAHLGHDRWQRRVALSAPTQAVPLEAGAFRNVGAVSVLSIDRRGGRVPYLYATLRSLFAELPADATVNVFVGNADTDYVAGEVLAEALGLEQALRVNVVATQEDAVAFMGESAFTLSERASWNYARMLRAYRGPLYHLTFEDDVQLSRGGLAALDLLLTEQSAGTVSMYNNKCARLPGLQPHRPGTAQLTAFHRDKSKVSFWGTQGVAYRGDEGYTLGTYVQTHLGEKPFDLLVDRYLRQQGLSLGYVYPSIVQHLGLVTTGLGVQHSSPCFAEDLAHWPEG